MYLRSFLHTHCGESQHFKLDKVEEGYSLAIEEVRP
jgi:hypothetical protein